MKPGRLPHLAEPMVGFESLQWRLGYFYSAAPRCQLTFRKNYIFWWLQELHHLQVWLVSELLEPIQWARAECAAFSGKILHLDACAGCALRVESHVEIVAACERISSAHRGMVPLPRAVSCHIERVSCHRERVSNQGTGCKWLGSNYCKRAKSAPSVCAFQA